jgi:hypothetical protein
MMVGRRFFSVGVLFYCVVLLVGCTIVGVGGCSGKESFSRTVELSSPMASGSLLKVGSTNGSIVARGGEMLACSIVAEITGWAKTKERAQELAEQTEVQLRACGEGLETVIIAPEKARTESICVGFDVTMPNKASLDANTTNGNIQVDSLTGDVTARTTNGNIKMDQVLANCIKAQTTNGSVKCHGMTGSLDVQTTNGSVRAAFLPQADAAADVRVNTTNGNVSVTLPKDCSVKIDVSTVNGRIKTDVPVMVSGEISNNSFNGNIGSGAGKLSLRTVNGSIEIH